VGHSLTSIYGNFIEWVTPRAVGSDARSVSTYHGSPERSGNYVVPAPTSERALD
jgi:hypothetical protein